MTHALLLPPLALALPGAVPGASPLSRASAAAGSGAADPADARARAFCYDAEDPSHAKLAEQLGPDELQRLRPAGEEEGFRSASGAATAAPVRGEITGVLGGTRPMRRYVRANVSFCTRPARRRKARWHTSRGVASFQPRSSVGPCSHTLVRPAERAVMNSLT